jgi:hypothetical protein
MGAAAARLRAAVTVSVRLTPAQRSAFEIYVADPAHTEDGALDGEGDLASVAQYRQVAACWRGASLVIPVDIADAVWRVIVDAANSADGERTPEGDRAARSLGALQVACSKALASGAKAQEAADPGWDRCPVCGGPVVGRCRCRGPHTCAQLRDGHGDVCARGHRWSGEQAVGPDGAALTVVRGAADLRKETRTLRAVSGVQPTFGERRR